MAGAEMAGLSGMANFASESFEKMGEGGMKMIEFGAGIFEMWGKAFETLLHKGGEFEQMLLRIQATNKTGDEARKLMADAIEFTQKLPITESDAVRIMTTLATAHVDALKPLGESYDELSKKGKTLKDLPTILGLDRMKKEGPNAVTIVGDMLAAMGHLGSSYQGMAIHEMMEFIETGMARSPMTFGPLITEVRKLGKHAHTAQDRLKGLQEILEKRGALGISVAAMNTLGGVMSNFKGLVDKVTVAIMEPGKAGGVMSQFVKGFSDLYTVVSKFFDDKNPQGKEFLDTMRDVAHTVTGLVTGAMRTLGTVIDHVFSFMASNPALVKIAALASLAAGALSILAGAALVVGGAIGGLVVLLGTMPEVLLVIPAAIGAIIASMIGLTEVFAVGMVIYQAWKRDFAGIRTFFEDVGMVIGAVKEALDDWHGGMSTISEDTAQKLEKAGVMGYFLKAVNIIRQAQVWWEGFSDTIAARWDAISSKFATAWEIFSNAFRAIGAELTKVFGDLFGFVETGQQAVDSATQSGINWGTIVANLVDLLANAAMATAQAFAQAIEWGVETYRQHQSVVTIIMTVIGAFALAGRTAELVFSNIASSIRPVVTALESMADLITRVATASEALGKKDFSGALSAIRGVGQASGSATGGDVNFAHSPDDDKDKALAKKIGVFFGEGASGEVPGPPGAQPVKPGDLDKADEEEKADRYSRLGMPKGLPTLQIAPAPIYLDGKKIAEAVFEHTQDQKELGGAH